MEPIKVLALILCVLAIAYTALWLWFDQRREKKIKEFKQRVTNFKLSNHETKSKTKSN